MWHQFAHYGRERGNMSSEAVVKLHLNEFDGPLELLLHLINQSEMDIYDINISEITTQYLEYITGPKAIDINEVADYYVMAAKLMLIKSKLMLPVTDLADDEEADLEDPRNDLMAQLLNYQFYQSVGQLLASKRKQRALSYTRPMMITDQQVPLAKDKNPFGLADLKANYERLVGASAKRQVGVKSVIKDWHYTIESQIKLVRKMIDNKKQFSFEWLKQQAPSKEERITNFLAVLELAKYQEVNLIQPTIEDPLIIKRKVCLDGD